MYGKEWIDHLEIKNYRSLDRNDWQYAQRTFDACVERSNKLSKSCLGYSATENKPEPTSSSLFSRFLYNWVCSWYPINPEQRSLQNELLFQHTHERLP